MKTLTLKLAIGFLALALLAPTGVWADEAATSSGQKAMKEIKEAAAAAKDFTMEQKQAYTKAAMEKLSALNDEIDALEKGVQQATGSVRKDLEERLQGLKEQRSVVDQKLQTLKSSASGAWTDVKTGFDGAMKKLEESYQSARDKLK